MKSQAVITSIKESMLGSNITPQGILQNGIFLFLRAINISKQNLLRPTLTVVPREISPMLK